MSTIIILFCVVNFAASLQITTPKSTVDVIKGQSGQLKWEFSTRSGETFVQGGITVQLQGEQTRKTVAYFTADLTVKVFSSYSSRSWSATHVKRTKEVILNVQNVKTDDDGTYYLKLHFSTGSRDVEEEKGIKLNVLVKPFYPPGSFSASPLTSDERKKVTLKCEPEGSPKPIDIIWDKNDVKYKETDTNNPNLVFNNVSRHDTGTFVCKARNKAGLAEKNPSIQLIVEYKPVNTKFSNTSVLVVGSTKSVDLLCSAQANPAAKFRISGGGIPEETASRTGRISLKNVKRGDDGRIVSCTPYNRLGNGPTVDLALDVKVPAEVLTTFPKTMDAIEGRNYSVPCSASGDPAPDIIWLKDGAPLRNQPKTYIVRFRTDKTYESKSTLTLSPARRQDNGRYICQAKNRYGSDIESVLLNLMYLPEVKNTHEFGEKEVRVGVKVELNCEAVGNPRTTYYVWRWENGTVIQNKTTGKLLFDDIQTSEGGRLSCAGGSSIGEGKKRHINLLVRVPPRIIVAPQRKISLNESERLQLVCNASGVPKPTIFWYQNNEKLRKIGEHLSISYVTYKHKGVYTCTADNGIMPNASASTDVTIYYRPVITTTSAADTIVGAESGEDVYLVCNAEALPLAKFKWLSYPLMQELNTTIPDIVHIKQIDGTFEMKVRARFGAKYVCYAHNNRGNDTQIYEIRAKGPPEAPVLNSVKTYIRNEEDKLSTVHASIKWTPGYNGGQSVSYQVYYGPRADRLQIIPDIDNVCNCVTINDLEANKDYVFYVQALNKDGPSNASNIIRRKTKAFYGSASVERLGEGKIVKVSFWIYTKENLTKEVRYREKIIDSVWELRTTDSLEKPLVIEDLDPDKHYEFQVLWFVGKKVQITDAGEVGPWSPPGSGERSSSTLTKEEIIAVIAGVGGFLLIVILVLFLCLIRRRQKPKRDETVIVMRRQPQKVDVVSRRSLIGSVEDDPFESAHYGSQEKKKKTRDSYYLPDSEDMNTFTADNTEKRTNPPENSQAYQPYKFNEKSKYSDDDGSSSDNDSYQYKTAGQKQRPSDDEISSEPGYARLDDVNGKIPRDQTDGSRDQPRPNPNDIYSKVSKRNNNKRPTSNGRGAPPPYRPRSTAETPLPPYPNDQLDLDDPSAVPFDDPLPPPMPVLPTSHSIPDGIWDDRYSNDPRDSVGTTLERQKSPSRTSLGGKPYINAQGKLVRPGSSSRYSSSENVDDSEQRLPEPEVPSGRSRPLDLDNDENNLVSYLV